MSTNNIAYDYYPIYDELFKNEKFPTKPKTIEELWKYIRGKKEYVKDHHKDNGAKDNEIIYALNDKTTLFAWYQSRTFIEYTQENDGLWASCNPNRHSAYYQEEVLRFNPNTYGIYDDAFWYNNSNSLNKKNGNLANYLQSKIISFPANLQKIGKRSFSNCNSIKSLDFQERTPNNTLYIYEQAFSGCYNLRKIHLPKNTHLHKNVFAKINIETFYYYSTYILDVGDNAPLAKALGSPTNSNKIVDKIENLTIILEDNAINNYVFNNTKLHNVHLKNWNKLEHIGSSSFRNAEGTVYFDNSEDFFLPENLKTIGDFAFEGCKFIPEVLKLPHSLESLGKAPFANTKLKKVIGTPKQHDKFITSLPADVTFEKVTDIINREEFLEPGVHCLHIDIPNMSSVDNIQCYANDDNILFTVKAIREEQDFIEINYFNPTQEVKHTIITIKIF